MLQSTDTLVDLRLERRLRAMHLFVPHTFLERRVAQSPSRLYHILSESPEPDLPLEKPFLIRGPTLMSRSSCTSSESPERARVAQVVLSIWERVRTQRRKEITRFGSEVPSSRVGNLEPFSR